MSKESIILSFWKKFLARYIGCCKSKQRQLMQQRSIQSHGVPDCLQKPANAGEAAPITRQHQKIRRRWSLVFRSKQANSDNNEQSSNNKAWGKSRGLTRILRAFFAYSLRILRAFSAQSARAENARRMRVSPRDFPQAIPWGKK